MIAGIIFSLYEYRRPLTEIGITDEQIILRGKRPLLWEEVLDARIQEDEDGEFCYLVLALSDGRVIKTDLKPLNVDKKKLLKTMQQYLEKKRAI